MAFFEVHCKSEALGKQVRVNVVIPGDRRGNAGDLPVVWLLHGLSDDESMWARKTSVERYAERHGFAVVMPNGDRSWYLNQPSGRYEDYIGEELPALIRGYFPYLSQKREDNLIAGLSMGGYGALHTALKRPVRYGAVACFSGAFCVTAPEWTKLLNGDGVIAGDPTGGDADVFALAKAAKDVSDKFPVYLSCGTEDALLGFTRKMRDTLTSAGFPVSYSETAGGHEWDFWDREIRRALDWWADLRKETK